MGKESLIKSTAKKKDAKEDKPKKTTAKKKAAKTTSKASPKKTAKTKAPKSTAKKTTSTKSKAKPKAAVKKTKPKAAPKKTKPKAAPKAATTSKKPKKKLTPKELLLKSFSPISKVAKPQPATKSKVKAASAPPFVSAADPKESARIRSLLLQSHSMADVKSAAKAPVAVSEPAAVKQQETNITEKPTPVVPPVPAAGAPVITTEIPPVAAPDPVSKAAKMLVMGVGLVILLVLMVSYNNSSKYYIQPKDKAVEIWKGRFSPKDKKFFMVLHGTQIPGDIKDVYSKTDVFPLIFTYYLNKADTLLEVPGLPDFDGIKGYLGDANQYAINNQMSKTVGTRLNNIERMILLYKADVAISKHTVKALDSAMVHLKSAQKLITDPAQEQEIQQKLNLATRLKAALKAKAPQKGK